MGSEWRPSTWGDEISLEYGKSLKGYREGIGNVRVYGSNGPVGWTESAPLSEGPGVILGRKGAYRGVQYSENPFYVIDTAYFVKPKTDLDMRWLYYSIIHHKLGEIDDGSPIPSTTRSAVYITDVDIPPLSEQKAIAHILGTLDDKIELNRRLNATLEGMAQALFKSWFVDFDPVIDNALAAGNPIPDELAPRAEVRKNALASSGEPSRTNGATQQGSLDHPTLSDPRSFPAAFQFTEEMGWIPEGWEATTLSELLEVKYGKDHKKLAEGKFPVYGSGGLMRHAESALYKGESVLIPRKGTLSNILYLNEEFWTVDTMFYTIPKVGSVAKFCYYHLKGLDFTSMNVGSAVPSMTTKVLNNLPIAKASDDVLEQFDALISAYFRKAEQNNKESHTLTKLRDTLLPKLISGELDVSEHQQSIVEELV